MFYSQCLLSRKGPLGAVLIAAYCHSRLKKAQVIKTDIPFSVKKIMDEGFPAFTYRILGYLLLGVVRIYSRKVEYVLLDCNQMLLKARQAVLAKRNETQESSFLATQQFITLPGSLELDKFIFEDTGVEKRDHLLPTEEIMLKDLWTNLEAPNFPLNVLCGEGVSIDLETFLHSGTPNHDILPPYPVDMRLDDTLMCDMDSIERGIETLIQNFSSPLEACEAEMVNLPAHLSSCPVISSLNNDEKEAQNLKRAEAESSEGQRELAKKLSVTVERSPKRNLSDRSDGDAAPHFKALPTPVKKENLPVKRKRKCLIDEQVVLSNKTVKENIDYSRDLVRKKGRVPQTALSVWKHGLLLDLKKNLTHPLVHCGFLDSNSHHHDNKRVSAESPNLGASNGSEMPGSPDDKRTDNHKEKIDGPEVSAVEKVGEHIAIAPETPLKDARLEGFPLAEGFERVRGASSSNSTEEESSAEQHEELPTEVYNSTEANFQEPDGWSASTRQALQDLSAAFSGKNGQQAIEQVNLHDVLKGKSKGISAKMFYDILVLKGRGVVNVRQEKPYAEILVAKSALWEAHHHVIFKDRMTRKFFSAGQTFEVQTNSLMVVDGTR